MALNLAIRTWRLRSDGGANAIAIAIAIGEHLRRLERA